MISSDTYKLRHLTVEELGLPLPSASNEEPPVKGPIKTASESPLDDDDDVLITIRDIMKDGYAGAIFAGSPGTGKTWYARKVAVTLARSDESRTAFVQFHPSYQYEDFVQGFDATTNGWVLGNRVFAAMCASALDNPDDQFVLVIDEFSRTDVARVFGEALTYIETSKRGMPFKLQSGEEMTVPPNLFIIATMNPWDRGVDDLDVAMERRFATVEFPPNSDVLAAQLSKTQMSESLQAGVIKFFNALQEQDNEHCRIGHAYFNSASDEASLNRLWKFRLFPHFQRAARLDRNLLKRVESLWASMVLAKMTSTTAAPASAEATDDVDRHTSTTKVQLETDIPPST